MSDCDCQENIKEAIEYGPTIAYAAAEKPDGLLITTIAVTTVRMLFGLRAMGVGQHDALLTSRSLLWLLSLQVSVKVIFFN